LAKHWFAKKIIAIVSSGNIHKENIEMAQMNNIGNERRQWLLSEKQKKHLVRGTQEP
jgi:hypothetical protein